MKNIYIKKRKRKGDVLKKTFAREYLFCWLLMLAITISYGHSTFVYMFVMITLVIFTYYRFVKYIRFFPDIMKCICLYFSTVSVFIGLIKGQFQDVLMCNVSILLPFVFSTYPVKEGKEYKSCMVLGILGIIFDLIHSKISVFYNMNINTYSFLIFISFSAIFILVRVKKTVLSMLMMVYCAFALTHSGSRNAMVIYLVVAILTLLPYKILTNKIMYRLIYIVSLGFQCVSNIWMNYVENTPYLSNLFYEIVDPYINKAWGIENRIEVYANVSSIIWNQDIFSLLFGNGVAFHHAHNGFYQTVFLYGIIGFIFVIIVYIVIFEMGLILLKSEKNEFIAGCFICICGVFLLQGADVFLFGVKTCTVLPFLLSSVILRKYLFPSRCYSN